MDLEDRKTLIALLRCAALQTIPEAEFWDKFKALSQRLESDPYIEIAGESAIHFWRSFHLRSIFFLIPKKPSRQRIEQGANELNLIAKGIDEGWDISLLEKRLKDI